MIGIDLFWDSCVFIRYITRDEAADHYQDIARFVGEAKAGKRRIYYSTISLAEFRQDHFVGSEYGGVRDFFEDMGAACIPIEPNPNVMIATGELRSAKSTNPGRPSDAGRPIATPDAIIMMSCIFAREALGITDIVLHSTDEGKNKGWHGRCVPFVGFERWFPDATRTDRVKEVCSLTREKPIHPEPMLEGIVVHGNFDTKRRT